MKMIAQKEASTVTGGLIVNPLTVKLAITAGKAVGKAAVAAAGAAGTYAGYKGTKRLLNR